MHGIDLGSSRNKVIFDNGMENVCNYVFLPVFCFVFKTKAICLCK